MINLTKIMKKSGVEYLLKSIAMGDNDRRPADGLGYYHQQGNPPGTWLGTGLAGLGLTEGAVASKMDARNLFSSFLHPATHMPLGNLPTDRPNDGLNTVSGFDLTFTIPKDISILWGTADRELQAAIEACHEEALQRTIAFFEENVLATRSGAGGVAKVKTLGCVAIAYKHFESRNGDPHLHTHLALANRVQRAYDGKWLTLDSDTVYRHMVALSEMHANLLYNTLRQKLGMTFSERPTSGNTTRAVVLSLDGMPPELVERFSSRQKEIRDKTTALIAEWEAEHDGTMPQKVYDAINLEAWSATRKPKPENVASLETKSAEWVEQLDELGYNREEIKQQTTGKQNNTTTIEPLLSDSVVMSQLARAVIASWVTLGSELSQEHHLYDPEEYQEDLPEKYEDFVAAKLDDNLVTKYLDTHTSNQILVDVAKAATARLSKHRSTWTVANMRAEAERLIRLIYLDPDDQIRLINAITEQVTAQCVRLSPRRYELPEIAKDDLRLSFNGVSVFDRPGLEIYTSQQVLDAEAFLTRLTTQPTDNHIDADRAAELVAAINRERLSSQKLSDDQIACAHHLLSNNAVISAVVGPAGAGKTTTMDTVRQAWEQAHGRGTVIGVAPSARAARQLGDDAHIGAHTLAGLLKGNTPDAIQHRQEWRQQLDEALASAPTAAERNRIQRKIIETETAAAAITIRPGTLIIVDEASMCTTHDLNQLARLAVRHGAKIGLVGDHGQLNAVGAGGFLGQMARAGQTKTLTTLFRFNHKWEEAASLRLRDGDPTVFTNNDADSNYATNGRIVEGDSDAMLEAAYQAMRKAQQAGQTSILIAATNEEVTRANERATLERRALGEVDSTHLVRLRDTTTVGGAGVGDLIIARKNSWAHRDCAGCRTCNGDLFQIIEITNHKKPNQKVTAIRVGTDGEHGETVTFDADYLAKNCELGYATTAHRAQGITVDSSHLYIPYGASMTRELLYVAMTRGKDSNHAYVGIGDEVELAESHISPKAPPTADKILTSILAASGAELTAQETQQAELAKVSHLGRLVSEHNDLAGHAIAPKLHRYLAQIHGAEIADKTRDSVAWETLVTLFRRSYATNPARSLQLLRIRPTILPHSSTASDFDDATETDDGAQLGFGFGSQFEQQLGELYKSLDRAQWWLDSITADGAQETIIQQATKIATAAKAEYEQALAAWQADPTTVPEIAVTNPDGSLAEPETLRKLRQKAYYANQELEHARNPETHLIQIREAMERRDKAIAAIRAADPDYGKIFTARLRQGLDLPSAARIDDPAWLYGIIIPLANQVENDKGLADMLGQTETKIAARVKHLRDTMLTEQWVTNLPPAPDRDIDPDLYHEWELMAVACAIYRDMWLWDEATPPTSPLPLGAPLDEHTAQGHHQKQIQDIITAWETGQPRHIPNLTKTPAPDPREDPDYDWFTQAGINPDTIPDADQLSENQIWEQYAPKVETEPDDRIWLTVPYPEKDAAKAAGARWDATAKQWWAPAAALPAVEKWVQIPNTAASDAVPPCDLWVVKPAPTWRERTTETVTADQARLDRFAAINQAAWEYWQQCGLHATSWVPSYLENRHLDGVVTPALAPPGYTTTLDYLKNLGYQEQDIIAAGIAKVSSSGRVLDVFRDYLPIPIHDPQGRIAGFTARANPANNAADPQFNPKYLNTPATDLYHKRNLLAGLNAEAMARLRDGWTPVLCEGALDVAAIKASGAPVVPLAPCGTGFTPNQLHLIEQIRGTLDGLTVAFDQDSAGIKAAAKLFDTLGLDANQIRYATWHGGKDPGELVERYRSADLAYALEPEQTKPLAYAWVLNEIAEADTIFGQVATAQKIGDEILDNPGITLTASEREEIINILHEKLPQAYSQPTTKTDKAFHLESIISDADWLAGKPIQIPDQPATKPAAPIKPSNDTSAGIGM